MFCLNFRCLYKEKVLARFLNEVLSVVNSYSKISEVGSHSGRQRRDRTASGLRPASGPCLSLGSSRWRLSCYVCGPGFLIGLSARSQHHGRQMQGAQRPELGACNTAFLCRSVKRMRIPRALLYIKRLHPLLRPLKCRSWSHWVSISCSDLTCSFVRAIQESILSLP